MVYKFRVEMTYDKKLNYIRHLNDLDKIWKIKIFNDGEETVRGLQIKLSFVPDFAESWIGHIDEIKAGERADINEPNLVINPEKLLSYNEKLEGNIIVELMPADGQSEAVYKEAFPLTVLPYDQWLSNDHPELLAAFVTPNDRRVLEILAKEASFSQHPATACPCRIITRGFRLAASRQDAYKTAISMQHPSLFANVNPGIRTRWPRSQLAGGWSE